MGPKLIAAVAVVLIMAPVGAGALPGTAQVGQSCRAYHLAAAVHVTADCPDLARTADALLAQLTGVDCPVFSHGACDEALMQARADVVAAVAPHACGDHDVLTVNCDETARDVASSRRLAQWVAFTPLRLFHRIYCAGADPTATVPTWCE